MRRVFAAAASAAIVLLLTLAPAAYGQASKQDRIVELLEIMKTDAFMADYLPMLIDMLTTEFRRMRPDLPERAFDILAEETKTTFQDSRSEFIGSMVPLYEKYFTEDEIVALIEFYRTPLGQKIVDTLPALSAEAAVLGQQWGQALAPRAIERITERLRSEGYQL